MSAEGQQDDAFEFDLDEDLFNFDEAASEASYEVADEDLDAIFAAFGEDEEEALEVDPAPVAEEAVDDELDFALPDDADDEWIPDDRPPGAPVYAPVDDGGGHYMGDETLPPRSSLVQAGHSAAAAKKRWMPSGSTALILFAVTSVNALVAVVALKTTGDMKSSVMEGVEQVSRTAEELRRTAAETPTDREPEVQSPVVPPDAENHPTFDRVQQEIEQGQFASARRRLYALLSIIDRLAPEKRARVEARANYFIAQAWHLEAISKLEVEE